MSGRPPIRFREERDRPNLRLPLVAGAALLLITCCATLAPAQEPAGDSFWPSAAEVREVLSLRAYNTRMVFFGTFLLGMTAGVTGTFMLLRKRALVGDVVGHCALPGIALAFLIIETLYPGAGRSQISLLGGAFLSGLAGVLCLLLIRKLTRIKEDAALAIVLSLFFGMGIVLLTVVQKLGSGQQAGLPQFIYGRSDQIIATDVWTILALAVFCLACSLALFKEFTVLCFDDGYASASGWPAGLLDMGLMLLLVMVTVTGLQIVGLILVVALLIIPPASARFWTSRLGPMTALSGLLGAVSASAAVLASALFRGLPTGALIVLCGAVVFAFSLLFGPHGGAVPRAWVRWRMRARVGRHDLLRAIFEHLEPRGIGTQQTAQTAESDALTFLPQDLVDLRTWTTPRVKQLLRSAGRDGLVTPTAGGRYLLTQAGAVEARRATRNHRLWELFLIRYADIAPSHVHRNADEIEHVLAPEIVAELTEIMKQEDLHVPENPHADDTPAVNDLQSGDAAAAHGMTFDR